MDGALLQAKVYAGYAKSAQRIGLPCDVYRPTAATTPLASGNKVGTIPASFTQHKSLNFNYGSPGDYKNNLYHGLFDGAQTQPGDYLVGAPGTFFIASQDPIVPMLCVGCFHTVTIAKADSHSAVGLVVCDGAGTGETVAASGWPASIIKDRAGAGDKMLPTDAGSASWEIILPAIPGVTVNVADVVIDDLGRRYSVWAAELSKLGWRIYALQNVI